MDANNHEGRLLTTGEAAELLGVSVDTIRSWHRQGRLPAMRTAGGQRRFREGDVRTMRGGDVQGSSHPGHAVGRNATAPTGAGPLHTAPVVDRSRRGPGRMGFLEDCDPEIVVAQAELEALRIRRESDALSRQMEREAQEAARCSEAERIAQQTRERLEELKVYGRSLASDLPTEWRQQVVSDLETYVTAKDLPLSLPEWEAQAFVAARVQQIRSQHLAEAARQAKEAQDQSRVEILKWLGRETARAQTLDWDHEDAEEARAEIADELQRRVRPGWIEADVQRLVDRLLANWEEDDDDEEGDEDEE